jgi:hypothetical protein
MIQVSCHVGSRRARLHSSSHLTIQVLNGRPETLMLGSLATENHYHLVFEQCSFPFNS